MEKCEKCLYYKSKEKCGECGRLSNVMDNKPMFTPNTNYNCIKSMSVEEMAEFIERMTEHLEICTHCPAYKMCDTHIKCGENIKQWLEQEVSEDDTARKES